MNRILIALALAMNACGGAEFEVGHATLADHGDADVEAAVADDAATEAAVEASWATVHRLGAAVDSGQLVADSGHDAYESGSGDADVVDASAPPTDGPCTPLTHSDGLGQTYQDCAALGTMNYMTAYEACAAYSGSQGVCSAAVRCISGSLANSICYLHAGTCDCWDFAGATAAHVSQTAETANGCTVCTTLVNPSWN